MAAYRHCGKFNDAVETKTQKYNAPGGNSSPNRYDSCNNIISQRQSNQPKSHCIFDSMKG